MLREEALVRSAISRRSTYAPLTNADLRAALLHARETVPFYRDVLRTPPPLRDDDLHAWFHGLPYTTKANVTSRLLDLCSDDIAGRTLFRHETSGTTGEPVTAIIDSHDWHMNLVSMYLKFRQLCNRDFERIPWNFLQVTIYPYGASVQIRTPLPGHPFWRRVNVPAIEHLGPKVDEVRKIARVLSASPTILNGLPTGLMYLARFADQTGIKLSPPLLVVTSGEHLADETRSYLEDRYKAPVYSFYSAGEVGVIGFECPRKSGFHVENRRLFLEVAHSGEVIATAIENAAMPLIRYRTGDFTDWKTEVCDCGDPRPMLSPVIGRDHRSYYVLMEQAFGSSHSTPLSSQK